jgi:hypothetical protein
MPFSGDAVIEGPIIQKSAVTCGSIVTDGNLSLTFKSALFPQMLKLLLFGVFDKFRIKF